MAVLGTGWIGTAGWLRIDCTTRVLYRHAQTRLGRERGGLLSLVGKRHRLSSLSALVPGFERRWHRRPERDHVAARLFGRAWRRRDLDFADLSFAYGRFRLRRLESHRYRSD